MIEDSSRGIENHGDRFGGLIGMFFKYDGSSMGVTPINTIR